MQKARKGDFLKPRFFLRDIVDAPEQIRINGGSGDGNGSKRPGTVLPIWRLYKN